MWSGSEEMMELMRRLIDSWELLFRLATFLPLTPGASIGAETAEGMRVWRLEGAIVNIVSERLGNERIIGMRFRKLALS